MLVVYLVCLLLVQFAGWDSGDIWAGFLPCRADPAQPPTTAGEELDDLDDLDDLQ